MDFFSRDNVTVSGGSTAADSVNPFKMWILIRFDLVTMDDLFKFGFGPNKKQTINGTRFHFNYCILDLNVEIEDKNSAAALQQAANKMWKGISPTK